METGQALDHEPRPAVRVKKKQRAGWSAWQRPIGNGYWASPMKFGGLVWRNPLGMRGPITSRFDCERWPSRKRTQTRRPSPVTGSFELTRRRCWFASLTVVPWTLWRPPSSVGSARCWRPTARRRCYWCGTTPVGTSARTSARGFAPITGGPSVRVACESWSASCRSRARGWIESSQRGSTPSGQSPNRIGSWAKQNSSGVSAPISRASMLSILNRRLQKRSREPALGFVVKSSLEPPNSLFSPYYLGSGLAQFQKPSYMVTPSTSSINWLGQKTLTFQLLSFDNVCYNEKICQVSKDTLARAHTCRLRFSRISTSAADKGLKGPEYELPDMRII